MANTVTVTFKGADRFTVAFSKLGNRQFGPWDFPETVRDLRISALLSAQDARDLVLASAKTGSATIALEERHS